MKILKHMLHLSFPGMAGSTGTLAWSIDLFTVEFGQSIDSEILQGWGALAAADGGEIHRFGKPFFCWGQSVKNKDKKKLEN